MKTIPKLATAFLTVAVAVLVLVGAWRLATTKATVSSADKPPPAASVDKIVKEDDLNTLTLSEAAEKRIGLQVEPLAKKEVRRVRVYGGEVTVPVGKSMFVAAPLPGILKAPARGEVVAGERVKAGQAVFQLTPLLTPDGRATLSASLADAEGQVNNAKTQVELAKIALERAKRVLREGAGSQRQVDEAQAAHDLATKTLEAVYARLTILKNVVGDAQAGTATPLTIESPDEGILRTVTARPGQTVPNGAALFEVVNLTTVWVRVPVPVGDSDHIDRREAVPVGPLAITTKMPTILATPVVAPPSANPLASTVDVFYELPNREGALFPGQRLGVTIPLKSMNQALVVSWSAIVVDIHGNTWVYEQVAPHRYARRRVVVEYTQGRDAVLASGPPPGTKLVSTGVQELFGAETGFVK